jgi:subtilisin
MVLSSVMFSIRLGRAANTISGTSMATHASSSPAQIKSALQTSGTTDWNNSDDHDSTKEKLLNVDGF